MSIVTLRLPVVKRQSGDRPKKCPYCEGEIFQRWGEVRKPIRDTHCRNVRVYRYRCCRCGRTFRHYPQGTTRADQSERLRVFAVICWTLGMSYRGVSMILSGLGIRLGQMTVWRDAQEQAERMQRHNHWRPVRVLGVDGAYVLGWGEKRPVLVGVDLGNGQPVALGYVDEADPGAVRRWLEPLVQRLGVSVIVTDDLMSYHRVSEQLNLGHQVCQFHVRRWVGRTLRDLRTTLAKDWHWVLDEIEELIEALPPEGDRRLYALWKQLPGRKSASDQPRTPLEQLRILLLRLSETWKSYCLFDQDPEVPWTNNLTEQAIGRMKMRARTVRGYKTWPGMQTGMLLAGTGIG